MTFSKNTQKQIFNPFFKSEIVSIKDKKATCMKKKKDQNSEESDF